MDLRKPSFVMCECARSISTQRLVRRLGRVGPPTLGSVEDRLGVLFAL